MAENETSADQLPTQAARDRAQQIKASVNSLFRHCEEAQNPVLAFSRACSKIGYLARDGVRGDLFHLESALNEHKHALLAHRYKQPEEARKHITQRDRDLRSFGAAVRRELTHPRQPPPTPELRARIHVNLDAGQWSRARSDLEILSQRTDIGPPLQPVDAYARSWNLSEEHHKLLQDRVDTCNAAARSLDQRLAAPARDASDGGSPGDGRRAPAGKGHESLSTPELHEHIQGSLTRGSWSQAVAGIDALMRRGDNDRELRGLSTYERSDRLDPTFAKYLQDRIEGCNAAVELKQSAPQCHALTLRQRYEREAAVVPEWRINLSDRMVPCRDKGVSPSAELQRTPTTTIGDPHRAPTNLVHAQNAPQRASSAHALAPARESTGRSSPQPGVTSRAVQDLPARGVRLQPSKDRGLDR
jgi:hypothetical protein